MPNFKLTTSAIVAGISLNTSTTANANESFSTPVTETSETKHEVKVNKREVGFNPKGGLLDSGFCCADCREWEDIVY